MCKRWILLSISIFDFRSAASDFCLRRQKLPHVDVLINLVKHGTGALLPSCVEITAFLFFLI